MRLAHPRLRAASISATHVVRGGAAQVDDPVGVQRGDLRAGRCVWPLSPTDSMSRPAWSPGGFVKTLPKFGWLSGWVRLR